MSKENSGDARLVALETLKAVEAKEAFLQPALEAAARRAGLDGRDRGLALELTSGVLRQLRRLDHRLKPFLRLGIENTDAHLLRILRLGVYQLDFMERVPARAAVFEAVAQGRRVAGEGGAMLVNAILSAVQANAAALPDGDSVEALGVRYSHPDWLVALVLDLLGPEQAPALLAAHNRAAPLTIRSEVSAEVLTERLTAEGATLIRGRFAPDAWHLDHPSPFDAPSFTEGLWQVQDEAAQLVAHLVDPQPGDAVWDVCAAPGGKSRHLLHLMRGAGALLSTDTHASKVQRLAAGPLADRPNVRTAVHDARNVRDETFDRVLLDAPCSGLGTLRRHPEIRWRRTPESIGALADDQRRMLDACAHAVRPAGVLIYSVCTITEAEGPAVIEDFLKRNSNFRLDVPVSGRLDLAPLRVEHGIRTWPHRHDMDGFFAARLRRLA